MSFNKWFAKTKAATQPLLGTDHDDKDTTTAKVPIPPDNIQQYNDERLKEGLRYADQRLRNKTRKVSPIAGHCLSLYKGSIQSILTHDYADKEERDALLSNILMCERSISTCSFLNVPDSTDATLVQRLAELRRYEYAARYGDYLANVCQRLKTTARLEGTPHFEQLGGWRRYWTTIGNEINDEAYEWKRYRLRAPDVTEDKVKTTLAVYWAAINMGLDFDNVLSIIAAYADRNSLVHRSFEILVEQGKWNQLRDVLAQDLRDIPFVTPHHLRHMIPILRETILAIIDEYYERSEDAPFDHDLWVPKATRKGKGGPENTQEEKLAAEMATRRKIEADAHKGYQKLVADRSMIHLAAACAALETPTGELPPNTNTEITGSPREQAARIGLHHSLAGEWNKAVHTVLHHSLAGEWNKAVHTVRSAYTNVRKIHDKQRSLEAPIHPSFFATKYHEDDVEEDDA